jgi:hypothetical protein
LNIELPFGRVGGGGTIDVIACRPIVQPLWMTRDEPVLKPGDGWRSSAGRRGVQFTAE